MPSILLLEDDTSLRELLHAALLDQGHTVISVSTATDAVEQAASRSFDLIVADIRMKGMDGLEAIERTKRHQPQIGTMVVSGYASAEETRRATELDVGAYLRKPFRVKEFLRVVAQQLQTAEQQIEKWERQDVKQAALQWALHSLTSALDSASGGALVAQAGQMARALAEELNLQPGVVAELELAARLLAVQANPLARPPEWMLSATEVLPAWRVALSEENSLEGQLAHFAAAAALEGEAKVMERLPADGEVRKALAGLKRPRAQATATEVPKATSLLALAQALESTGEASVAQKAYQTLKENPGDAGEAVLAALGLAEWSWQQGAAQADVEKHCQEALSLCTPLGPSLRAQMQLQVGINLFRARSKEAIAVLRENVVVLRKLGFRASAALAMALLHRAGEAQPDLTQALPHLLIPSSEADLLRRTPWLMAELLELPWPAQALAALVARYADIVARSLQTAPGPTSRQRILWALEEARGYAPDEMLQLLCQDSDPQVRKQASQLLARTSEQAPFPLLRVYSFSPLEVFRGERAVTTKEWRTKNTLYFFAMLASQWGRPFHEETVIEQFWPESEDSGKQNLYWSVSTARSCLRGSDAHEPDIIVRRGAELLLTGDIPYWHDLDEFRRFRQAARASLEKGMDGEALQYLRAACRLYRGPYLEGCNFPWAVSLREELEHQAGQLCWTLGQILLKLEYFEEAVEVGQAAIRVQPYRPDLYESLMRAYLGCQRPADAIALYHRCELRLRRDFGVEPTVELTRVYLEARMA